MRIAHGSFESSPGPAERFLRAERLLVLATVRASDESALRLAGVDRASSLLASDKLDLTVPLLADQLSGGLWGQCRRAAAQLGLIAGRGSGPDHWELTGHGTRLAAAAKDFLSPGTQLSSVVTEGTVSHVRLEELLPTMELGAADPRQWAEAGFVGEALLRFDERHDREFERLFETWCEDGGLGVRSERGRLTEHQVLALDVLSAIDRLSKLVERAFRNWLSTGEAPTRLRTGTDADWRLLSAAGEQRLSAFGAELTSRPTIRTIDTFHQRLMASRGRTPWTRRAVASGELQVEKFDPVETRLAAASSMFEDGAEPGDYGR